MSQPNRILPQSKETLLKSYTKRLKDDVKSILDNFTEIVKSSKVTNLTETWGLKPAWRLSLLHWALSSEQTIHLTSIFTQDYFEANGVNYFLLYCISFRRCVYFVGQKCVSVQLFTIETLPASLKDWYSYHILTLLVSYKCLRICSRLGIFGVVIRLLLVSSFPFLFGLHANF